MDARWTALAVTAMLASGCVGPGSRKLTEEDLRIVRDNILSEAPEMRFGINASLEGNVTYLGMDVDQEAVQPGKAFTLIHYWKCHQPVSDWNIFVHLHGPDKQGFINADHQPIGGRHPVSRWRPGEIVRDEHQVTLPPDWPYPEVWIYTGLWRGSMRMKIQGPQDQEDRVVVARIPVRRSGPTSGLKRLVAVRTEDLSVKVDGRLDDRAWSRAPLTDPFVDPLNGRPARLTTRARAAWDGQFLYIAFENQDDDVWGTMSERDQKLWTQEAVELFLDADGDGRDYIEIQVNPKGTIFDSFLPGRRQNQNGWNSKLKAAVLVQGTLNKRDDKDSGWTAELALPWADARGPRGAKTARAPVKGDEWPINMFRVDTSRSGQAQGVAWSPPMSSDWHELEKFGRLVFGDETGKQAGPTGK